ncbi:MAG: polysaccharide deacetylase family protein [Thaumarchaeota archaeon]|nr:polysaccharide deacetylase family protein [Nitrososphaerota archaeon]
MAFSVFMFSIPIAVFGEINGSIAVTLIYTNGDTADYWPVSLKIYQDTNQTPYKEIESVTGNPFNIISLPINHQYKIVAYANGMYSSVSYVNLQQSHQDVTMKMPLPGGMRINVFYNDGITPIANATVSIKSAQDNKTWAQSYTNTNGESLRFWIQPTTYQDDRYIVEIHIGNHLSYSESPVYLRPGTAQETKIITNWPPMINSLITAKIFNQQLHPVGPSDGKFTVNLFDNSGREIANSPVTSRGEAYFSNIKVGDYTFKVMKTDDNSEWASTTITEDGTITNVQIIPIKNNTEIHYPSTIAPKSKIGCNCIAFRLDNIQDYWLDDVQIKIIDSFVSRDIGITTGIIGNTFGNDTKIVSYLKSETYTGNIDTAINGWNFEDFTTLTKNQQADLLQESRSKISNITGINPIVFIPPYGKANNDTLHAMADNNITIISGSELQIPQDLVDKVSSYPASVFPSILTQDINQSMVNDKMLSSIDNSIQTNGYAIVALNFQDYAMTNGTIKIDTPDMERIQNLEKIVDNARNKGYQIITINKLASLFLNQNSTESSIYKWSQNEISNAEFIDSLKSHVVDLIPDNHNFTKIPNWAKHNAVFYDDGQISEKEFLDIIRYLIGINIIE